MAVSTLRYYSASNKFKEFGDLIADALIDGMIGAATKHKLVLVGTNGGKFVLKGDFKLSGGEVIGGKITGYTAFMNGNKVMKATGYDVAWAVFKAALDQAGEDDGTSETLFYLILNADRTLGSAGDDLIFSTSPLIRAGGGNDTIYASFGDKTVKGEGGNDLIVAGLGDDRLFGGGGRDIFAFTSIEDGIDRLKDFNARKDRIGLDEGFDASDDFFAVGTKVDLAEFVVGEAALTADHHLIYDRKSGKLWWDGDGVGGTGQVLLARLPEKLKLTAANFVVDDFT